MLTSEEQEAILHKAQCMRRNFYQRRLRVLRGEISPKRSDELAQRELDDLRELLKEVG